VVSDPAGAGPRHRIPGDAIGAQPEAIAAFWALYEQLWRHGTVDHRVKEVARLRNARITDCGY
jgi:hypothetical protein